jgi:hypothetical protein
MEVLILGLVVSIPVTIVCLHQSSRLLQAFGGTCAVWWMLGFVFYIVVCDMKKRWPHLPLSRRWGMLFPDVAMQRKHDAAARQWREEHATP